MERCRIESHAVHSDRHIVPFLLEVNITHVDSEPTRRRILLILHNDRVGIQSLLQQSGTVVHVGEVVKDVESEIDVHLV